MTVALNKRVTIHPDPLYTEPTKKFHCARLKYVPLPFRLGPFYLGYPILQHLAVWKHDRTWEIVRYHYILLEAFE